MGRKFDARLPDMSDKELYAVEETSLDVLSLRALKREIAYRQRRAEEEIRPGATEEGREMWRAEWVRWAVGVAVTIGLALAFASWGTD
jgi:hypothetical protein